MTNALRKDTLITTTPGSPGTPDIPGTPGRPAYWAWEDVTVCRMFLQNATYAWQDGQYTLIAIDPDFPAVQSYKCVTTKKPVLQPAVAPVAAVIGTPPVPEQTTYDFNLGWNSGARSVAFLVGDGYASFTVVAAVGVAVGFNGENLGEGYAEMEHAIYLSGSVVRIYEAGVEVFYGGPFVLGDEFTIKRMGGEVTYWRNTTLLYTSEVPSTGIVFMDVSMYSGGDEITDPEIGGLAGGNLELPAMGVMGGEGDYAQAILVLPALTMSTAYFQGAALELPAFEMMGSHGIVGQGAIELPAFTMFGSGGFTLPAYGLGSVILPAMQVSTAGLTGEIGGATMEAPAMLMLGSEGIYGEGRITLPTLRMYGEAYEGNLNASMGSTCGAGAALSAYSTIAVVMTSTGQVVTVASCSAVLSAAMEEQMQAAPALTAQALLSALMEAGLLAVPSQFGDGAESNYQVWCLDLDTAANTQYEQFEFNSFARIGDAQFGAKADGVYLLEGEDDDGEPIRASAHFGRHDFGTTAMKRVPHVYAGVSGSGNLVLRVQVDGGTAYLYDARAVDTAQKVQRFDLGKGLKGSYYSFEIYNEDGADFDLDSIEFHPVAFSRRI